MTTAAEKRAAKRLIPGKRLGRRQYVRIDPLDRFNGLHEKCPSGCWEWSGTRLPSGYGRFSRGGDNAMGLAHRWPYEHFVGPIPSGYVVGHLCRNPSCVNPEHLEAVTPAENNSRSMPYRDMQSAAACRNGHPWSEKTAYWTPDGKRN